MYVPRSNFVCVFPISKPWHDTRLISLISRSAVLKSFDLSGNYFKSSFIPANPTGINGLVSSHVCMVAIFCRGGNRVQQTFCRAYVFQHCSVFIGHTWNPKCPKSDCTRNCYKTNPILRSLAADSLKHLLFQMGGQGGWKNTKPFKVRTPNRFWFWSISIGGPVSNVLYDSLTYSLWEKKHHHQCGTTGRT